MKAASNFLATFALVALWLWLLMLSALLVGYEIAYRIVTWLR